MLAGILKSDVAVAASLKIVDTFIAMRHFTLDSRYVNSVLVNHEERIKLIENTFDKFKLENNIH